MIRVKEDQVDLIGDSLTITAELGVLLHAFRIDFPDLYLQALTAEEMIYNKHKEGK